MTQMSECCWHCLPASVSEPAPPSEARRIPPSGARRLSARCVGAKHEPQRAPSRALPPITAFLSRRNGRRHAATWISWPRPEGISFPGRYQECIDNVVEVIRAIARVRAGAPQRPEHRLRRHRPRAAGVSEGADAAGSLSSHPHQRVLDARSRAGVRAAHGVAGGPRRRSSTGATTRGAESIRRSTQTMRCRASIGRELGLPVFHPGIVMEGGAVDFNGAGTVLTTTSCLLNKNRNPDLSQRADRASI